MNDKMAKALLGAFAGAALATLIGYFVGQMKTDFMVLWAAHHVPNPYDADMLQQSLSRLVGEEVRNWPYFYPPTFLALSSWFAVFPPKPAYLIWLAASAGGFVAAARHPAAPLLIFSPWALYAFMAGQTSPLLGALVVIGLTTKRPVLGICLGVAACIKPQIVVIPAIALLLHNRWSSFGFMIVGAVSLIALTDFHLWQPWLKGIPLASAHSASLSPHLELSSLPLRLLAGAAALWFIKTASSVEEIAVYATGVTLLIMPHSVWYLSALMVPALALYLYRYGWVLAAPLAAVMLLFPSTLTVAFATFWPGLVKLLLFIRSKTTATSGGVVPS